MFLSTSLDAKTTANLHTRTQPHLDVIHVVDLVLGLVAFVGDEELVGCAVELKLSEPPGEVGRLRQQRPNPVEHVEAKHVVSAKMTQVLSNYFVLHAM